MSLSPAASAASNDTVNDEPEPLAGPGNSFNSRKTQEIELMRQAYEAAAAHSKPAVHPSAVALAFASAGAPVAEHTSLQAISRITELYIRNLLADLPESEVVRPPSL
eukprot:Blabericola_migrator_1__2998@NODE_186_length_11793_cov_118_761556_g161_i0_p8_GENE_NODE_186_length_11793_cov_118_761556_g161_i0NODE_186_length_11793_cov_118_761556_g161_i0_p8_ORF_typecomplete_len107_score20_06_NODE_186_length_11793_cov_118_761556_g161_i047075027